MKGNKGGGADRLQCRAEQSKGALKMLTSWGTLNYLLYAWHLKVCSQTDGQTDKAPKGERPSVVEGEEKGRGWGRGQQSCLCYSQAILKCTAYFLWQDLKWCLCVCVLVSTVCARVCSTLLIRHRHTESSYREMPCGALAQNYKYLNMQNWYAPQPKATLIFHIHAHFSRFPISPISQILTVHNEHDAFANCWRYAIGGNAEIGAHIQAIHFGDGQKRSIVCDSCGWRNTEQRVGERDREIERDKSIIN